MLLLGADPNLHFRGLSVLQVAILYNRPAFVVALLEFGATVESTTPAEFGPFNSLFGIFHLISRDLGGPISAASDHHGIRGLGTDDTFTDEDATLLRTVMLAMMLHIVLYRNETCLALRTGPYGFTGVQVLFSSEHGPGFLDFTNSLDASIITKRDFMGQSAIHYFKNLSVTFNPNTAEDEVSEINAPGLVLLVQFPRLVLNRDFLGNTILHFAASGGRLDIIDLVFDHYEPETILSLMKPAFTHAPTPLHEAFLHRRHAICFRMISKILEVGDLQLLRSIVNSTFNEGQLLLHHIPHLFKRWESTSEEFKSLLEVITNIILPLVVDINAANRDGLTVLHFAAIHDSRYLSHLLENGANPELKDSNGMLPWDLAITVEAMESARILGERCDQEQSGLPLFEEMPSRIRQEYATLLESYRGEVCQGISKADFVSAIAKDNLIAWHSRSRPDLENVKNVMKRVTSSNTRKSMV